MSTTRTRARFVALLGGVALVVVACGRAVTVAPAAWTGGPISASSRAVRGPCTVGSGATPCPTDGPRIGDCPVFPGDNWWNTDISNYPVDPNSSRYLARIAQIGGSFVHPDFGSNPSYGIPYTVVGATQPLVPITYNPYGSESDPGPFPIPLNARVEAGSDRHVLVVQQGACQLFELFAAQRSGNGWTAGSGRASR